MTGRRRAFPGKISLMRGLRLTTLGRYAFTAGDAELSAPATFRARALLVYLVLNRERDIARETLVDLFWPGAELERARASLKTATWSIRRMLRDGGLDADAMLVADRATMRWNARVVLDVQELQRAERSDDPSSWRLGMELYRGDFLEGDYDQWAVAERERIADLYESLLRRLVAHEGDRAAANALVERNPYDETPFAVLIEAALERGDRPSALALSERCREALAEVGTVPSHTFEVRFGSLGTRAPQSEAPQLRFAGRNAEQNVLREHFAAAAARRGSVTVVTGSAGMGKSALLARARRLANDAGLRAIACSAFDGDPRAFGPWESLFEALCGEPFARFGAGGGFGAASRLAEELQRALRDPSAILIDDAHFLAGEPRDVLLTFSAAAASAGHAVVIATRPSERSCLDAAQLEDVPVSELELTPLDARQLAYALGLGNIAEHTLAGLHRRSGGHPLFAGTLLEVLWQGEFLQRSGTGWLLRPLDDTVPETLRDALERRLRSRGEHTAAAACALALEPGADASMLAYALETGETTILDALDDLIGLRAVVQPDFGPPFRFSHDVVAEVASTLLNRSRCARLHARFADVLAGRAERGFALRRARHLAAAHRWAEALSDYAAAASEAYEWGAWRESLSHAHDGLEVARRLGNAADLTLCARLEMLDASAHVLGGDDNGAQAAVAHAVSGAHACGDTALEARALRLAAAVCLNCHRIDDAIAAARSGSQLAERVGDRRLKSQTLVTLTSALAHTGTRDEAVAAGRSALDAAQGSGDDAAIAAAADILARTHVTWWQFDEALAMAALELTAARRAGWLAEAAALTTRAIVWFHCDALGRARDDLELSLRIASDDRGERRWAEMAAGLDRLKVRYFTRYMLGVVALGSGDVASALALAEQLDGERLTKTSYMIRNNILHLWIDALLERRERGDVERAGELVSLVREDPFEHGSVLDLSGSRSLAFARVAAFSGAPDAERIMRDAWNALEQASALHPLASDRAFERFAVAAEAAGLSELAAQAFAAAEERAAVRTEAVRQGLASASEPALTGR
jgi:DNA-binding SARP family transcriptional activator